MNHSLSDQQIDEYRREGFIVVEQVFGATDLDLIDLTIRQITDHALSTSDFSNVLELEPEPVDGMRVPRRIYNPYDHHEHFRSLAHDPRLADKIESLISPNFNLQHSKLNMKPAKVGSAVEWHQDMAYFPHTNDDLVTTLIYLDDATEANGCLQVLPRHHTHFFRHSGRDGRFAGMITEDLTDFGTPKTLPAPAGSVIFMHCITPHSSLPNRSTRPRRTLIYEYRANDSFPIFCGEMTNLPDSQMRLIRGKPMSFARFGGPSPPIPQIGKFSSLYELQAQALVDSLP